MALMVAEVYDAFRAANVPEEQARKAAEAMAVTDDRFERLDRRLSKVEGELVLHRYMLGTILGGVVVLILKAFF
jgi:hypothetical protein